MKKFIFILSVAFLATVLFNACKPKDPSGNTSTTDEGVVINGVKWATRNIGATGTFVTNPQDNGGYYQWNRKDTANFLLPGAYFDSDYPTATSWLATNNPCPSGWRLPTDMELEGLGEGTWTTKGREFGTAPNTIFLPAAGWRYAGGGLSGAGEYGGYWSSTENSSINVNAYNLHFGSGWANMNNVNKVYGHSVRCVAE